MKRYLFLRFLVLVLFMPDCFAQGENNIWTMGYTGLGLDFNSGSPVFYPSSIITDEAAASVCDSAGRLLFYTNSVKVYDRTHAVMPNGNYLQGHVSTTQGAAIAQLKFDDSLYFIFTLSTSSIPGNGLLHYTMVNMKLNGGLGDVVSSKKNIYLKDVLSEKMIIAGKCSNQWIIVHHNDSGIFYAYKLDGSYTIGAPVESKVGINKSLVYNAGEMKISPDMKTIALANVFYDPPNANTLQLFDFDVNTGIVSNARVLDTVETYYGVEFSPNGKLLYSSSRPTAGRINQFDLSLGSTSSIIASKTEILSNGAYGMRRGPDNDIYVCNSETNFSRIRNPDIVGLGCNFQESFLPTDYVAPTYHATFGNQFLTTKYDTFYTTNEVHVICPGDTINVNRTGYSSVLWNDGSTSANRKLPPVPATYWVRTFKDCILRIDTFIIKNKAPVFSYNKVDTSICETSFSLHSRPDADSVLWHDGSKSGSKTFTTSDTVYWVKSYFKCAVIIDTYQIKRTFFTESNQYLDTNICFQHSIRLTVPQGFEFYEWSGLNTTIDTLIKEDAKVIVKATNNKSCKKLTIEFNVHFINFKHRLEDTMLCKSSYITLDGSVTDSLAVYRWNSGESTPLISTNIAEKKSLAITTKHCYFTKSIEISNFIVESKISGKYSFCQDSSTLLSVYPENATYLWSTRDTIRQLKVTMPGLYSVITSLNGCNDTAIAEVKAVNCINCLSIPNAFTPNDDGKNDFFSPVINCPILEYEIIIINRWGNVQYSSNDPLGKWDGKKDNQEVSSNVFYYLIKAKFEAKGDNVEIFKGDILLIR